jgi:hypothetical protein
MVCDWSTSAYMILGSGLMSRVMSTTFTQAPDLLLVAIIALELSLTRAPIGYGMIFRTIDGGLMHILHQPFNHRLSRGKLFEMEDTGDSVRVKKASADRT